ncbi:MAG TPA: glyoxalase [Sphingobacteriaceae bacterium]
MADHHHNRSKGAVFITFSGNCKKALTFYQTCFGGTLQFETFEQKLQGYTEMPVVSGSLVSDSITIHGSDLVHNEGRVLGNYMSIFLHCTDVYDRKELIGKLEVNKNKPFFTNHDDRKLIEITDAFDVRWILGV